MTNTYHKKEEKYIRFGQTFLSHQKKKYNKEKRKRVMRNADRKKTNRKGKTICNNYRIIGFGRNSKKLFNFSFLSLMLGKNDVKISKYKTFFKGNVIGKSG